MYYTVFYKNRCMGFKTDLVAAQRLVEVLGPGSDIEECPGRFPVDELLVATEHNARRAQRGNVVTLRPEASAAPVEVTEAELDALAEALQLKGLDEDPWAEPEHSQFRSEVHVRGTDSGFFSSTKVS